MTAGATYNFRVFARNSVGYSLASSDLSILVASPPDQVEAPTTARFTDSVVVTWLAPYDGSTQITSYTVSFLGADGTTYSEELTDCDGTDADIVSTTSCTVPSATFIAAPFSLEWGQSVYA